MIKFWIFSNDRQISANIKIRISIYLTYERVHSLTLSYFLFHWLLIIELKSIDWTSLCLLYSLYYKRTSLFPSFVFPALHFQVSDSWLEWIISCISQKPYNQLKYLLDWNIYTYISAAPRRPTFTKQYSHLST